MDEATNGNTLGSQSTNHRIDLVRSHTKYSGQEVHLYVFLGCISATFHM